MWKCVNCGKENQSNRADCWKCGTKEDGTPPENPGNFTHLWTCAECGKANRDVYTECGNCTARRDGGPPGNPQAFEAVTRRSAKQGPVEVADNSGVAEPPTQSPTSKFQTETVEAKALLSRYWDAYLVARMTVGLGEIIKVIAVVFAVLIMLAALLIAGQASQSSGGTAVVTFFLGVIGAAFVGGQFYLLGIIVMAQGQILKASLDSAVNSSPFLQNEQRAKIMSLK